MFLNILVPVDFTPKNKRALKIAKIIAAPNRSRITLLHVIEKIEYLSDPELRSYYKTLEKKAYREMKTLVESLDRGYPRIFQAIHHGNRAEQIIRYATNRKIDLIVLNSRQVELKRAGFGWGTISFKVAGFSPCPVMLVK